MPTLAQASSVLEYTISPVSPKQLHPYRQDDIPCKDGRTNVVDPLTHLKSEDPRGDVNGDRSMNVDDLIDFLGGLR